MALMLDFKMEKKGFEAYNNLYESRAMQLMPHIQENASYPSIRAVLFVGLRDVLFGILGTLCKSHVGDYYTASSNSESDLLCIQAFVFFYFVGDKRDRLCPLFAFIGLKAHTNVDLVMLKKCANYTELYVTKTSKTKELNCQCLLRLAEIRNERSSDQIRLCFGMRKSEPMLSDCYQ